jgi:hypothetical protein
MITIAIRQIDGEAVHISEVDRGLACVCVCADCGERFVARQGQQRAHVFAHYTQTNCQGEGNLHKKGKQIVIDELRLTINHPDLDSPVTQMFETARQEVARGSVRIDCLMDIGNKKNKLPIDSTELAVEIKVSHAVDEQKRLKLRELGLQTIEINLTKLADPDAAPSTEDIRKAICDTPSNIKWVDLEKPEVQQLAMDLDRPEPPVEEPEIQELEDEAAPSTEQTSTTRRGIRIYRYQNQRGETVLSSSPPPINLPSKGGRPKNNKRKKPYNRPKSKTPRLRRQR